MGEKSFIIHCTLSRNGYGVNTIALANIKANAFALLNIKCVVKFSEFWNTPLEWTTQKQRAWLQGAREAVQSLWEDVYKFTDSDLNQAPAHLSSSSSSSEIDDLATFMNPTNFYNTTTTRDEYAEYCRLDLTPCKRPLEWWETRREKYSRLSKMAFDLLSILLMSAECERVFSFTK
jgi:hypothetical protein